jgi:hypothetical protein
MTRRQSSTAWARTRRRGLPEQFVLIGIVTARSQAARKDFDMTTEPAGFLTGELDEPVLRPDSCQDDACIGS